MPRVRTADTLGPAHEFLGICGGFGVDHVADIVLVHALDLHAGRRRGNAGEVDDIVIDVLVRDAASAFFGWG